MSITTDLATIGGNITILTGRSNYQRWAWSVEGTAQFGGFWVAYGGTTVVTLTDAQKESNENKTLSLIMETINPNIALKIQSIPDIINTTVNPNTTHSPNAKDIWIHLKSRYQKTDSISSLYDYRQLHCTTLIDDGTLEDQLNHLIQLHSRCAMNGLKLENYQFTATILIALLESYSHITNTLLANSKMEDLMVKAV